MEDKKVNKVYDDNQKKLNRLVLNKLRLQQIKKISMTAQSSAKGEKSIDSDTKGKRK